MNCFEALPADPCLQRREDDGRVWWTSSIRTLCGPARRPLMMRGSPLASAQRQGVSSTSEDWSRVMPRSESVDPLFRLIRFFVAQKRLRFCLPLGFLRVRPLCPRLVSRNHGYEKTKKGSKAPSFRMPPTSRPVSLRCRERLLLPFRFVPRLKEREPAGLHRGCARKGC
jgi:hypothetical protein